MKSLSHLHPLHSEFVAPSPATLGIKPQIHRKNNTIIQFNASGACLVGRSLTGTACRLPSDDVRGGTVSGRGLVPRVVLPQVARVAGESPAFFQALGLVLIQRLRRSVDIQKKTKQTKKPTAV